MCAKEEGRERHEEGREREEKPGSYIIARRTSPIGITPSFSPSMGSENSPKASLISASSSAEMLFSLASLDSRGLGALESLAATLRRFAGYKIEDQC